MYTASYSYLMAELT